MVVQVGQTYYIDPDVAIGYDYQTGLGDPNFQSVTLPVGIGDGLYDIFGYDDFTGTQTPIVVTIQSVPEPASLALVGLALAGLPMSRRRRKG